jgi:hypothetical protein
MRRQDVESDRSSALGAQVCNFCVRDAFLSRYIKKVGKATICDYCWATPKNADVRCIPLGRLVRLIRDGITWAYNNQGELLDYEYRDLGWPTDGIVFDTYDLIVKEIGFEADEKVLHDIIEALPSSRWCQGDTQRAPNDALSRSWNEFVDKVKYRTRYLFTIPEPDDPKSAHVGPNSKEDKTWSGHVPAYRMLDTIGRLANRMHLVRPLKTGTPIYRVRVESKNVALVGPKDLGPPSRDQATRPNRMSPAGIVMFYGALDRNTALVETLTPELDRGSNVWVARFETTRRLHVLDLSALPAMPSIFDPAHRCDRNAVQFLYSFVTDLKQPVRRNDEHINYVPTQVVTEYFRHRFRDIVGRPLDGVLYPTSKREQGTACVLFIDGSNCGVAPSSFVESLRFMYSPPTQVLRLCADPEVLDGGNSAAWLPY